MSRAPVGVSHSAFVSVIRVPLLMPPLSPNGQPGQPCRRPTVGGGARGDSDWHGQVVLNLPVRSDASCRAPAARLHPRRSTFHVPRTTFHARHPTAHAAHRTLHASRARLCDVRAWLNPARASENRGRGSRTWPELVDSSARAPFPRPDGGSRTRFWGWHGQVVLNLPVRLARQAAAAQCTGRLKRPSLPMPPDARSDACCPTRVSAPREGGIILTGAGGPPTEERPGRPIQLWVFAPHPRGVPKPRFVGARLSDNSSRNLSTKAKTPPDPPDGVSR